MPDNFSLITGFYQLDILLKPVVWNFSGVYVELFFEDINKYENYPECNFIPSKSIPK